MTHTAMPISGVARTAIEIRRLRQYVDIGVVRAQQTADGRGTKAIPPEEIPVAEALLCAANAFPGFPTSQLQELAAFARKVGRADRVEKTVSLWMRVKLGLVPAWLKEESL